MKRERADIYRAPRSLQPLRLKADTTDGDEILRGALEADGARFEIIDGIPFFCEGQTGSNSKEVKANREYYESVGEVYDAGMDWLFRSFYENEEHTRAWMVDLLEIRPRFRVLETGCGTCRDTSQIRSRLSAAGELFVTDLAPNMLRAGRNRLEQLGNEENYAPLEFFVADASHLPFDDGFFDAAYHFGGINVFDDVSQGLKEMARVVKVDGKVVVGDEAIAPWLRESEYGQVLLNSNPLYHHEAPLHLLPDNAKDVRVRWFLGNAFYLIDYRVGAGPPRVNLDLPIPGRRGGTHRSRYYGRLEGVSPELKALAERAAETSGKSYHVWLEDAVRTQVKRDLDE